MEHLSFELKITEPNIINFNEKIEKQIAKKYLFYIFSKYMSIFIEVGYLLDT